MENFILNILNKFDIKNHYIITYSIILNAFGLLSLLYGDFFLFVLLFASSMYLNKIYNLYTKEKKIKDKYIEFYANLADYIKLIPTYIIFTNLYSHKITLPIIILSSLVLVLCNINFTVLNNMKKEEPKNVFIKHWNKITSWMDDESLEKLYSFTKYFNENFIITYFIIIIIYIHYFR